MLIKSRLENIKCGMKLLSSKSPSIQALHQRIRGGDGVLVCADSADAEGVGGSKIMGNMLT